MTLTRTEKVLYHQLHPLKLLTDVGTSFASSWLLWQREWALAAAVAFLPSFAITAVVMWRADLERYRDTAIGRYTSTFLLRRSITAVRLGGQAVMWAGAAAHVPWLLPLGFMIVVYAWLSGLWR